MQMRSDSQRGGCSPRQPMFHLPVATRNFVLALIIIHIIRSLLPQEIDLEILLYFAFIPSRELGNPLALISTLTYSGLHADVLHLILNAAGLAALASPIEVKIGAWRMIGLCALSSIVGAFAHDFFYPNSSIPLIGASSALSGCLGALLVCRRLAPQLNMERQSLFLLCIIWIGLQFLLGFLQESDLWQGESIAWAAHIGGFVAGGALGIVICYPPQR